MAQGMGGSEARHGVLLPTSRQEGRADAQQGERQKDRRKAVWAT